MIIKIRDPHDGWWLFDDLDRVKFGFSNDRRVMMDMKDPKTLICEFTIRDPLTHEYYPIDFDCMLIDFTIPQCNPSYCHWVSYRTKNGDEKLIVFNTVGYILNDDGKTIEIIR